MIHLIAQSGNPKRQIERFIHPDWQAWMDASDAGSSDSGPTADTTPDAVRAVRGIPGWLLSAVEATSTRKRAA